MLLSNHGMKLGDFERRLLATESSNNDNFYKTICYGDCDDSCDQSCDEKCDGGCNQNCNEGCDEDCDQSCDVLFAWSCDSSCDSSCDLSCNENCNTGCDDDCDAGCNDGCDDECIDYYPKCENMAHLTVNWDNLLSNKKKTRNNEIAANININDGIDSRFNSIVLNVTIESEYKVLAKYPSYFDSFKKNLTFGFTYVVDTYYFTQNNRKYLADCNECENRLSSSFDNVFFKDYWTYSQYPSQPNQLGNDSFLEYPNANLWSLTMANPYIDACGSVAWHYVFTLHELITKCGFTWYDNKVNNTIDLVGTFYLMAISPNMSDYNEWIDKGSYLIQTILSQDVSLPFTKASSLNDVIHDDYYNSSKIQNDSDSMVNTWFVVNYFGCSVVSVGLYRIDNNNNYVFSVTLLTYVPNWMKLDDNSVYKTLLQPTKTSMINDLNGIYSTLTISEISMNTTDRDCYILDSFRCWQKWQISFQLNGSLLYDDNNSNNNNNRRSLLSQIKKKNIFGNTVIEMKGNYTFQTQYSCTLDNSNNVNDYVLKKLCEQFSVSDNSYETNIITMDTQYLDYQILTLNDSSLFTDDLFDEYFDYSEYFNNQSLEFYNSLQFDELRNTVTNPYAVNDTIFIKVNFDNILSFELNGIYFCYGSLKHSQLIIHSYESDSNYCLEDDSSIFEIYVLFDILNDAQFNHKMINTNNDDNNGDNPYFEFSFVLPNITNNLLNNENHHLDEIHDINDFWITVNALVTMTNGQTIDINIHNERRIAPSLSPTTFPSAMPSDVPSSYPTTFPSNIPSKNPSFNPTIVPSNNPTIIPTNIPTNQPSVDPTMTPSIEPSTYPSDIATLTPFVNPTMVPSDANSNTTGIIEDGAGAGESKSSGNNGSGDTDWTIVTILIIVCCILACCVFCLLLFVCYKRRKEKQRDERKFDTKGYSNPNQRRNDNDNDIEYDGGYDGAYPREIELNDANYFDNDDNGEMRSVRQLQALGRQSAGAASAASTSSIVTVGELGDTPMGMDNGAFEYNNNATAGGELGNTPIGLSEAIANEDNIMDNIAGNDNNDDDDNSSTSEIFDGKERVSKNNDKNEYMNGERETFGNHDPALDILMQDD